MSEKLLPQDTVITKLCQKLEGSMPLSVTMPTTASPDASLMGWSMVILDGSNTSREPTFPFVICNSRVMLRDALRRDDQWKLWEVGQAGSTFLMASMTRSSLEHQSQAPASCCAAATEARQSLDLSSELRAMQAVERGKKSSADHWENAPNACM